MLLEMHKVLIINADDLGISRARNIAILDGYINGVLRSASLLVNGECFDEAIDIIRSCPNLSVGIHLNIVEGTALIRDSALVDQNGGFKRGFLGVLARSNNSAFLQAVEAEFRAQIELAKKVCRIDHLDSHVHIHAIPSIFKVAVRLANEYQIPFIRTQYEKLYLAPSVIKTFAIQYAINLLKVALLNLFTSINVKHIVKPLRSNHYIIGVGYTGMMDLAALRLGVKAAGDGIVEAIIHPDLNANEYDVALSAAVKDYAPLVTYAQLS
ncbi:MAG: ChbG/HpnK family deacetylase, partial [Helicobacteraceae bacterium]|nr:ChbG/HpnK family deacetylase [Helicobacteraceae bacterium]